MKNQKSDTLDKAQKVFDVWQIISPFVTIFGTVSYVFIFFTMARSSDSSEFWDKLIYASALGVVLYFILLERLSKKKMNYVNSPAVVFGGYLSILIGIGGIEVHGTQDLRTVFWMGFGPIFLIVLMGMNQFIWKVIGTSSKLNRWLTSLALFSTPIYILSLFQTSTSLKDTYSSTYNLNESFAPLVGRLPFVDFVPQYSSFYGFLLWPIKSLIPHRNAATVILIAMFLISILTIGLGVKIVTRIFSSHKSRCALAFLFVAPLTLITQFPVKSGFSGSISSLLSALPERLFFGTVILFTFSKSLYETGKKRNFFTLSTGFLSGTFFWMNQDFSIFAFISVFLVSLIFSQKKEKIRHATFLILGFMMGVILYPLLVRAGGRNIDTKLIGFMQRQFTAGFGAERIWLPGPSLFVLSLLCALVFATIVAEKRLRSLPENLKIDVNTTNKFQISSAFAMWALIGFTYFLGRSYASGQLQILFLPTSISLAAFIGGILDLGGREAISPTRQNGKKGRLLSKKTSQKSISILVTTIFAVPFLSVIELPNPAIELYRIAGYGHKTHWPHSAIIDLDNSTVKKEIAELRKRGPVATFAVGGNYLSYRYAVPSALIVNAPSDIRISSEVLKIECDFLKNLSAKTLILDEEGVQAFSLQGGNMCGFQISQATNGFPNPYAARM
jgi:hypothetical protein